MCAEQLVLMNMEAAVPGCQGGTVLVESAALSAAGASISMKKEADFLFPLLLPAALI